MSQAGCHDGLPGNAMWGRTGLAEILPFGAQRAAVPFLLLLILTLLGLVPPLSMVCAGQYLIVPLHLGFLG